MRGLAVAAMFLLLGGCGGSLPSLEDTSLPAPSEPISAEQPNEPAAEQQAVELSAGQPVALSAEQRADVETGVKRKLVDPNSAMFGSMNARVSRNTASAYIVCGWVNSRNSDGGYAGDQPFIAMYAPKFRTALMIGMGGEKSQTNAVKKHCLNEGVPLGA